VYALYIRQFAGTNTVDKRRRVRKCDGGGIEGAIWTINV